MDTILSITMWLIYILFIVGLIGYVVEKILYPEDVSKEYLEREEQINGEEVFKTAEEAGLYDHK